MTDLSIITITTATVIHRDSYHCHLLFVRLKTSSDTLQYYHQCHCHWLKPYHCHHLSMWLKTLTTVTHLNAIVIGTTVTVIHYNPLSLILKISQPFPLAAGQLALWHPSPLSFVVTRNLFEEKKEEGKPFDEKGGGEYFWFSPSASFPLCCRVQTAESHSHFYSRPGGEGGTWGLFRHWAFFNKKLLDYKNKAILEKTFSNKINIICLN